MMEACCPRCEGDCECLCDPPAQKAESKRVSPGSDPLVSGVLEKWVGVPDPPEEVHALRNCKVHLDEAKKLLKRVPCLGDLELNNDIEDWLNEKENK